MEKNKIAYLIRGEKWSNIRKVKEFRQQTKEVEWIDAQDSIVADIKAYEDFMVKMKDAGFEDLGDLDAYEKSLKAPVESPGESPSDDLSSKTKDELKAMLDEKSIEYAADANKADLIALLGE